jgi:CheY-like chemotaxis protein
MQPKKSNALAVIVEDNALLSNMFSRALQDIDYQTQIIEDGRRAIEWLSFNVPDLLLLDLHLPYISGKDILERFERDPRFQHTYFVLVTADARMGETLRERVDFFLNKPVDLGQLQQMAQRLKNKRKENLAKII